MTAINVTSTARTRIHAANDEAAALMHEYIGGEHLLLALLADPDCVAAQAITQAGGDIQSLRASIIAAAKPGVATMPAPEKRPYTRRVTKIFELAMAAARDDNRWPIGTDYMLLGMMREKMGIAAQTMAQQGVTLAGVEAALAEITTQEA